MFFVAICQGTWQDEVPYALTKFGGPHLGLITWPCHIPFSETPLNTPLAWLAFLTHGRVGKHVLQGFYDPDVMTTILIPSIKKRAARKCSYV